MALTDKLTAIGDIIRGLTETEELIPLAEMPEKVVETFDVGWQAGYEQGHPEGWGQGYEEGYTKGQEDGYYAGRQAEHDKLWDYVQQNGSRTNYDEAFSTTTTWAPRTFYPKYDIRPTTAKRIFYAWEGAAHDGFDLVQRLEECGVVLDTSQATTLQMAFCYAHFSRLPTIDLTGLTDADGTYLLFAYGWEHLRTIDKIIVNENTKFKSTFYNCTGLANLIFEGTLAQNGLYVNTCTNLSHDSLMSIINALKDYSNDTSGTSWVVTLGTENLAKLTDAEKAIATQKGWTLA